MMIKDPMSEGLGLTETEKLSEGTEITDLTGDGETSIDLTDDGTRIDLTDPAPTEKNETDSLEEMRKKIKEMEEEAKKMEALQRSTDFISPGSQSAAPTRSGPDADKCSVYVGNVDYSTTREELQKFFCACGSLERVTIICDKWTGQPKGFAYVQFGDINGVENAVLLDGSEFKNRVIKVTPKRTNIPGFNRGRGRAYGYYKPRYRRSRRPRYGGYRSRPRYTHRSAVYAPYNN